MSTKAKVKVKGDRLVLEKNPKLLVNIIMHGQGHSVTKFVHSNGVIGGADLCKEIGVKQETIDKVLDGVQRIISAGYEPRLDWRETGEAVRFYATVGTDLENVKIACATMGAFRKAASGLDFEVKREGETISRDDARAMDDKAKKPCVTPDTMVTCPECGCEFRVGKVLSAEK